MKNILFYLIITVLVIFNLFLIIKLSISNTEGTNDINYNENAEQLIENSRIKDELGSINKNCIVVDDNGNELRISDLITSTTLIFKISKLNCSSCINQNIEILNKILGKYNFKKGDIIVLYQDCNIRDQVLLKRLFEIEIPIYRIPSSIEDLQLEIDELNVPFFFLVDSCFQPNLIHVLDRQTPQITERYIEILFENEFRN